MCAQFGKMARKSGKGGRKRDFVYECFDDFVDKTNKTKRFECLYCDTVTSQNRSRMLDHLFNKCLNAPKEISDACGDELSNKIYEAADISASVTSTPSIKSILHLACPKMNSTDIKMNSPYLLLHATFRRGAY